MSLSHWLAFVATTLAILALPGPTVLMVVSHSLGAGRRAPTAIVAGVGLGHLSAMTVSMMGLSAAVSASARSLAFLRWSGVAYLIWLGLRLWRTPHLAGQDRMLQRASLRRLFSQAYAVTALNPKAIAFFLSLAPQFLDASRPMPLQITELEATFVGLATLNAAMFAWAASAAGDALHDPRIQRGVARGGGVLLMGAGLLAAAAARNG